LVRESCEVSIKGRAVSGTTVNNVSCHVSDVLLVSMVCVIHPVGALG
jgi:hypothetical protein